MIYSIVTHYINVKVRKIYGSRKFIVLIYKKSKFKKLILYGKLKGSIIMMANYQIYVRLIKSQNRTERNYHCKERRNHLRPKYYLHQKYHYDETIYAEIDYALPLRRIPLRNPLCCVLIHVVYQKL